MITSLISAISISLDNTFKNPPSELLIFFDEMRQKAVLGSKFCLVGVEEGLQKNMQIRGTSTLLIFLSAFIL